MSLLPPGYLAAQRARLERDLTDTCTLRHAGATVRDSGGGSVTTYTDETIECLAVPAGGDWAEGLIGDRLAGISEYLIKFPAATAVGQRDLIVWQGRTYAVTGVRHRTDGLLLIVGVRGVT